MLPESPLPFSTDPAEAEKFLAEASVRASAVLARSDLAAYRGWIKFLSCVAKSAAHRTGFTSETAIVGARRLDEWARRIAADPGVLGTLRGVQEWAYESPVDGSGQPFKLAIPTDCAAARPAALNVYLHGSSGNHLEHATEMIARPGVFDLSVLGRARTGGFHALSEADVLQAIDYVIAHWSIDLDRVGLRGGSMGGGGTYRLGARYPHRWSSGRPTCGYASHVPPGNLVTLPIYATHSADDWVVSVLHQRGPLARVRALGGPAILDETDGLGHAAWDYKAGNERSAAWAGGQVRPASRTVRRIDYTALDGSATRGWWAEIVEWGAAPKPARFVLSAWGDHALFAELTNLTRLQLRLDEAPFDRSAPLQVSVNGAIPIVLPAPLPARVVLAHEAGAWKFELQPAALPFRLHTPGSAGLLYDGTPLLIVYGTDGTEAERAAMARAAAAASRSPNPAWPDDTGEIGPDGVPDRHNLYGCLSTKADVEVTETDLAECHLVLIGTAAQNRLVARLADRLPVRFTAAGISCDDGVDFAGTDLALGLVHYNPLASQKLIYWVASPDPAAYVAGFCIPLIMAGGVSLASNPFGADLLVMHARALTWVAARSFDSRWRWTPGRESSPRLGEAFSASSSWLARVGAAIRRATGADFALVGNCGSVAVSPVVPGVTRVSDLVPLFSTVALGMFEMPGAELAAIAQRLSTGNPGLFLFGPEENALAPDRLYTVALPVNQLWVFSAEFKTAPKRYRALDLDLGDVVERFLVAP